MIKSDKTSKEISSRRYKNNKWTIKKYWMWHKNEAIKNIYWLSQQKLRQIQNSSWDIESDSGERRLERMRWIKLKDLKNHEDKKWKKLIREKNLYNYCEEIEQERNTVNSIHMWIWKRDGYPQEKTARPSQNWK